MNIGAIRGMIEENVLNSANDLLWLYKASVIDEEQLYYFIGDFNDCTKLW